MTGNEGHQWDVEAGSGKMQQTAPQWKGLEVLFAQIKRENKQGTFGRSGLAAGYKGRLGKDVEGNKGQFDERQT